MGKEGERAFVEYKRKVRGKWQHPVLLRTDTDNEITVTKASRMVGDAIMDQKFGRRGVSPGARASGIEADILTVTDEDGDTFRIIVKKIEEGTPPPTKVIMRLIPNPPTDAPYVKLGNELWFLDREKTGPWTEVKGMPGVFDVYVKRGTEYKRVYIRTEKMD